MGWMCLKLSLPPLLTPPQLPQPLPDPYQLPLTSSLLPSLCPIWLAPCSLGRGVAKSSVAVLANDAPPPPTHLHTTSCTRTHLSLQTNCCFDSRAPLAAPHWGESPTNTFLFPHAPRRWLAGWNTEAPHIPPCRHSP